MKTEEEIIQMQMHIIKKLNNTLHCYTTLSRRDTTDILLGLTLNWIQLQMEKENLRNEAP